MTPAVLVCKYQYCYSYTIHLVGQQQHKIVKCEKRNSLLYAFPKSNPSIAVEVLSNDPKSKDFLGFRIFNSDTNEEISRFRAKNIVELRKFMASLGGRGEGLFTKKTDSNAVPIETTPGQWDVIHASKDELHERQNAFDRHACQTLDILFEAQDSTVLYTESVNQLPMAFYFPEGAAVSPHSALVDKALPMYDPNAPLPIVFRRPWHDTFKPPNGSPVLNLVSIGYGSEIGLKPGLQAVWDPTKKEYFFLDHIHKVATFQDPRPRIKPRPTVQKQQHIYGDKQHETVLSPAVCRDTAVIEATTQRAFSKPHGFILYACGVSGTHGEHGAKGTPGYTGTYGLPGLCAGASGGPGGPGGSGGPGTDATSGSDGTDASDVILNIEGDSKELHVHGTCTQTAKLGGTLGEEVLFVSCRGGDGGRGGRGGDGGEGGFGGMGGNGATGQHGLSNAFGPGGNGGQGGNGGNGGCGGPGGPGGSGGDGGNAGSGGVCVLKTANPQLLVLVEADCTAGMPGAAGDGGSGGCGGCGGIGGCGGGGGMGGMGGSSRMANGYTQFHPNGFPGVPGIFGLAGSNGPDGPPGSNGEDGRPAYHGGILWVVNSSDGNVLHQSETRYDAEIISFKVDSANGDGIFEPNEQILVSNVVVVNSGGLPLPPGATAFLPSTKTVKFEPTRFELCDQIYPGQSFTIPITYHGRIFDQPPPNAPGPFVSSATFHPRIQLLGRPFEKSFLQRKLTIQYPVKLAYLRSPENLGRGEISVLEIGVKNISRLPYYGDGAGSGGKVALRVHLDARIIPVGSANISLSDVPYTITYDPRNRDSMYIQIHDIPPGQTVNIQVTIQMESQAELLDRCFWQADLCLRDKLIEYNFERIRVIPFYIPQDPTVDILLITSETVSRKEFVFWQNIFQILGVTVDFWDTTRCNGFSVDLQTNDRHEISWKGRYKGKLILYPHTDLKLLWGADIVDHFHGESRSDSPLNDFHSSMILYLPSSRARSRPSNSFYNRGDLAVLRRLAAVDRSIAIPIDAYGGKHLFQPGSCFVTTKPYHDWERKYLKQLEKEVPNQAPAVFKREVKIRRSTGFLRYNYGRVDLRRIPLLRSCKFAVYDGAGGSIVSMGSDDCHLSPSSDTIPLASNYGQVFLTTLYGMNVKSKLKLLQMRLAEDYPTMRPSVAFKLPNGYTLTIPEMVMVTIAWEVADEVYSCSGFAERMETFTNEVQTNAAAYVGNGRVILRGMKLIEGELKKRKKKMKNLLVNQSITTIKQSIALTERAITNAGVNCRDLTSIKCSSEFKVPVGQVSITLLQSALGER